MPECEGNFIKRCKKRGWILTQWNYVFTNGRQQHSYKLFNGKVYFSWKSIRQLFLSEIVWQRWQFKFNMAVLSGRIFQDQMILCLNVLDYFQTWCNVVWGVISLMRAVFWLKYIWYPQCQFFNWCSSINSSVWFKYYCWGAGGLT